MKKKVYFRPFHENNHNIQYLLGNLNFLSHNKRSNKLRLIKVVPEDRQESDLSSLDSNSDESLKSDIFDEFSETRKAYNEEGSNFNFL